MGNTLSKRSDYSYVDKKNWINPEALDEALKHYDREKDSLQNPHYLTVIDFSLHSSKKRLYLIDMRDGDVEKYHTAHGTGSDRNNDGIAEQFSNTSGSHQSSLGLYETAETYYGRNGYSLRLDGLSSTNSRARPRAIVIHPANYIDSRRNKVGRSWGCPALDPSVSRSIITRIKNGSLIYAWKR